MTKRFGLAVLAIGMASATTCALAQSGPDLYKSKCAMCHGADGSGNTPAGKAMKTPPFSSPDILSKSDADLIAVTKSGKGKMPSYAGKFTDPQFKDLIAYVRSLGKK